MYTASWPIRIMIILVLASSLAYGLVVASDDTGDSDCGGG